MTTDEQLKEIIIPILEAARAVDKRIETICVNIGIEDKSPPFIKFFGNGASGGGVYGVEANLATVKPYDPLAEKLAEIEKLKAEIEKLQSGITALESESATTATVK